MAPGDYRAVINQIITFTTGQMRATHTIIINQDDICENSPDESFFSNIALNSGQQPIDLIRPRVQVIIHDFAEAECSKCNTHYCYTLNMYYMLTVSQELLGTQLDVRQQANFSTKLLKCPSFLIIFRILHVALYTPINCCWLMHYIKSLLCHTHAYGIGKSAEGSVLSCF